MRYVTVTPKSQAPVWMFDKDLYGDKIKTKDDLINNLRGYILCAVPDVELITTIASSSTNYYRPLPFTITSSTPSLTELADPKRYPLSYIPSPEAIVNFGSTYAVCLRNQDGTKGTVATGRCTYYGLPAYQTNGSTEFNFQTGSSRVYPEIFRARIQKNSGSKPSSVSLEFEKSDYSTYPSGPFGTIAYGRMTNNSYAALGTGGADLVLNFRSRVSVFRGTEGSRLPTLSEYLAEIKNENISDLVYLNSSSTTDIGPVFSKGSEANLIAYQCLGEDLLVHNEFGDNIKIEQYRLANGTLTSQYRRITVKFKQTIFTKKV